jgi:hypothetical protein
MTLPSERPDTSTSTSLNTGRLSKVAGAGAGTTLVVVVSWLDLSPKATLVLQAIAPSVAVFIGAVGPSLNRIVTNIGKWIGLQFTLRSAVALAASMPEGSQGRIDAENNINEIHALLNDLIRDITQIFHSRK